MSAIRYLSWWDAKRTLASIGAGLALIAATCVVGIVQSERTPFSSHRSFQCKAPPVGGAYLARTCATKILLILRDADSICYGERPDLVTYAENPIAMRDAGVPMHDALIQLLNAQCLAVSDERIGAPFRCFRAYYLDTPPPGWRGVKYISLSPFKTRLAFWIPFLPLPGLFYSWAFWSVLAYAFLSALAFARITRRLAKGLCPKCAYDLGSTPRCPECGTTVRAAPTPATLSP